MNPIPTGIRADAASRDAGAGADSPPQAPIDAEFRRRLRDALERELALATAAGDRAAPERVLPILRYLAASSR
jgi:hypothetical protein